MCIPVKQTEEGHRMYIEIFSMSLKSSSTTKSVLTNLGERQVTVFKVGAFKTGRTQLFSVQNWAW